jgi:TetR/AcrR family transcriptional regulator, cholesterol catabolism regulator
VEALPHVGGSLRRRARYDEKLLVIMDQACEIFAQKGYHHASVRDVAAATGVSPGGLYYYFKSKEELLYLILSTCLTSLLERIRAKTSRVDDPALRLRIMTRTHLEHLHRHGKQMRVLVREWESLSDPFREEIRRLMRSYASMVIRALKELAPERNTSELRSAAFALFGMLGWVDQWYRPDRDLPLDLLADSFSEILLGGFVRGTPPAPRALPGRKGPAGSAAAPSGNGARTALLSGPGF